MRIQEKNGNFVITDFNDMEAYKIACKIEEDGVFFYKKILDKTKNKESKRILNALINEEEKHLRFFEELLFKLEESGENSWEGDDLLSEMDYGIFKPYDNAKAIDSILDNPEEIVKLAILIEDKSIKFYDYCKDNIKNKNAKKEISSIISEENGHKKLIKEISI